MTAEEYAAELNVILGQCLDQETSHRKMDELFTRAGREGVHFQLIVDIADDMHASYWPSTSSMHWKPSETLDHIDQVLGNHP